MYARILVLMLLAACTPERPEPSAPPAPSPRARPAPAPEPAHDAEPLPSTHVDQGIDVEYRVTARDCDEIAARVTELTEADMRAKLEGKSTTDKQREAAEKDIAAAGEKAREAWLNQCEGLVGEVQDRKRIDCAIDAPSMDAIDGCLNR
jgi:hypothetical protein